MASSGPADWRDKGTQHLDGQRKTRFVSTFSSCKLNNSVRVLLFFPVLSKTPKQKQQKKITYDWVKKEYISKF